jgi:hypothetical protein
MYLYIFNIPWYEYYMKNDNESKENVLITYIYLFGYYH